MGDHAASAAGSCDWRHGCQGSDRRIATAKLHQCWLGKFMRYWRRDAVFQVALEKKTESQGCESSRVRLP